MLTKETGDAILERLARIILMNAGFTRQPGLFSGKSGALIFLYNYARYKDSQVYGDYADELTITLSKKVAFQDVGIYSNGLAGIGWTFDYLVKRDFIEIGEHFYHHIDKSIFENRKVADTMDLECAGLGVYLCNQLEKMDGKWYQDVETMIKLEKVIGLIDYFEINHETSYAKLATLEGVYKMLRNNEELLIAQLLYHYAKIVTIVKKVVAANIYPTVSRQLQTRMKELLPLLITHISVVSADTKYWYNRNPHTLHLAYLGICNAYLQTCTTNSTTPDEIVRGCLQFDQLVHATETTLSEQADISKMINEITLLSNINKQIGDKTLTDLINRGWNRICSLPFLSDTTATSKLPACFLDENRQVRVGLSDGLSSIGMSLLSTLDPAFAGWEEGLLFT